jgi:hypothetical protein
MEPDSSAPPAHVQQHELQRFCAAVLGDKRLQKTLAEPHDLEEFVALVLETATQRGFGLSRDHLLAAIRDNRMSFMMRRIVR